MSETPKYILFRKMYILSNGEKGVLFRSQRDLAKAIVKRDVGYDNEVALESFLSQILRPIKKNAIPRPVPSKLLVAIIQTASRIIHYKNESEFIRDINKAFSERRQDPTHSDFFDPQYLWQSCLDDISGSQTHFLFPDMGFFQWEENTKARELIKCIADTFEFAKGFDFDEQLKIPVPNEEFKGQFEMIKIFLPDTSIILSFWRLFKRFLVEVKNMENDKVADLLSGQNNLFTYQVNPDYCILPMIYTTAVEMTEFGPTIVDHLYSLSLLKYNETSNDVSIVAYNSTTSKSWFNARLLPISIDPNSFNVKKLSFDMIKHLV